MSSSVGTVIACGALVFLYVISTVQLWRQGHAPGSRPARPSVTQDPRRASVTPLRRSR